ncbi:MAG: response regulator [Chloroflexota bacterium]
MSKRVLIIEDDRMLAEIWQLAFVKAGYAVEVLTDGGAAIDWLNENPAPDAIVTDYSMPIHTGEDVLDHLNTIAPENKVVKVVITANHLAQQGALGGKVDLLLVKPVRLADMVSFVDRFLGVSAV